MLKSQVHIDQLLAPESGWQFLAPGPEGDIEYLLRDVCAASDSIFRVVRGLRCGTKQDLFNEWAAALQFPYYFGSNWDAFDECINDLEWLSGTHYVFLVTCVDRVLPDSPDFRVFLETLGSAAAEWSARGTAFVRPFRIILQCEEDQLVAAQDRLRIAGAFPRLITVS